MACVYAEASSTIRSALSSSELRSIISTIDTAPNREATLQQFLTNNADLAQFVNELLHTIQTDTFASASGAAEPDFSSSLL